MENLLNFDFVLIPAGEFIMGSDRRKDRGAPADEQPCHTLSVSDYHILRYPVTQAQYRQFVEATGHKSPHSWPEGVYPADRADHPVTGVTLLEALEFCRWAAQVTGLDLRLPTEPEWEKAARGPDGRRYPWGNAWETGRCNSAEARLGGPTPVGRFSPQGDSPYGVAEMGGNVQEWILSLFGPYPYDPEDGREALVYNAAARDQLLRSHETGCTSLIDSQEASLDKCMLRGGSWREDREHSRCAYRSWAAPLHRSVDTGFRIVFEG